MRENRKCCKQIIVVVIRNTKSQKTKSRDENRECRIRTIVVVIMKTEVKVWRMFADRTIKKELLVGQEERLVTLQVSSD